ncbi:hypothetical protein RFI_04343 [Reticulomyxa filosa]|uniref:Mediator of RNA polymerase II transcription subunit 14 n=1 Tax=Reticulomyxa filosa TaxID=46433 RepID=X6P5A5_RETFI|nr:hypothetical protein RFI_04343 [Reticulomyxa filosa]|eukprot:ETO32777.1 hypothetical protein RFI_04343 [Reticulomyxa filosa]
MVASLQTQIDTFFGIDTLVDAISKSFILSGGMVLNSNIAILFFIYLFIANWYELKKKKKKKTEQQPWDVETALSVLPSGSYLFLPKIIEDAAGQAKKVTPVLMKQTSQALNDLIRIRLLCDEIPQEFELLCVGTVLFCCCTQSDDTMQYIYIYTYIYIYVYIISENGMAYLRVNGEFEIAVSLRMRPKTREEIEMEKKYKRKQKDKDKDKKDKNQNKSKNKQKDKHKDKGNDNNNNNNNDKSKNKETIQQK